MLEKIRLSEFKDKIVSNLIDEFLYDDDPKRSTAQQNAIILFSMIMREQPDLIKRIHNGHLPNHSRPHKYRGTYNALGNLGDREAILGYGLSLSKDIGPDWDRQRTHNLNFHILYYRGVDPALQELRRSIQHLVPEGRLAEDVFTLGQLAYQQRDIDLLKSMMNDLINHHLPKSMIEESMTQIDKRISFLKRIGY